MNQIVKTLLLLTIVCFGFSVQGVTPDNYDTIIDRNIFRLNEPPPPADTGTNGPQLDKNVELSGISNDGGEKKAWFVVKAAKPGPKDLPLYLNLSEGQAADVLTVVSISEEEGEVKILNSGNSMVLSLKNNSPKPMPVAPAAPVPGVPVANVPRPQPQPVLPAPPATTQTYAGATATVTGGPSVPTTGTPTTESSGSTLRSIPTRTLRLAPVAAQPSANNQQVDPVTQQTLMLIDNERLKQGGIPAPPLPGN